MAYVDSLVTGHGAAKYIGMASPDKNGTMVFPKYPLMRKIYKATLGEWVIWFDDDIYVTEKDWLDTLAYTINQHPEADQFGAPSNISLPLSVKEKWIDDAVWSRPEKIQYENMPDGQKIVSPFILGGFYALSRKAIRTCHIPDPRLFHNFGDWTTGMSLCHNGFKMTGFTYGIVFGDAPRRGIHRDMAVPSDDDMVLNETVQSGVKRYHWEKRPAQGEKTPSLSKHSLPPRFSMDILKKNLDAFSFVNASLVQRICLPVDGSHIQFGPNGQVKYQLHRSLIPFRVSSQESLIDISNDRTGENILLFGIGLGEQLDDLLKSCDVARIHVWDRDPWLIRLVLMQQDYSTYLRSGRLTVHMCSDLLDLIDFPKKAAVISHPILKSVYNNEYALLDDGIGEKRAIICSGGLFVDDVGETIKNLGYSLYTLDIKKLSLQEIETTLKRFDPSLLFSVDYTNGLAELCHKHDINLISWEVNPAADRLKPCGSPTNHAYIFTHRESNKEEYVKAGFQNIEFLPLAANPQKRVPTILSPAEKERFEAPMSFVGSSMIHQAKNFRQIFLSHYQNYRNGATGAKEKANALLEKVLSIQRQDYSIYRIPSLLYEYFDGFLGYMVSLTNVHDPFMLAAELAAAEKRINYISNLGMLGVKIWGDEGWRITDQYGAKYMGQAGHHHEVNKIYSGSIINLDINRLYQPDIVTMRVFDVMACGGFVLTEYSPTLEALFEIDNEVVAYRTLDELISKASYYLDHRDEAGEIADRGRAAVINRHTIENRVCHMLHRLDF
jgi:spore maturation protein CgeB